MTCKHWSYLGLAVVFNLGQVVGKLLQAHLQVGRFRVCVLVDFSNQDVALVPHSCRFANIGCKHLAQLPEMFLHIGDVLLNLPCLVVPAESKEVKDIAMNRKVKCQVLWHQPVTPHHTPSIDFNESCQ